MLKLFPLDDFVEAPVMRMEVVRDPTGSVPIFDQVQAMLDATRPSSPVAALERFSFYAAARKCFAVVRTSDPGPYGCFMIRKGAVTCA